MNPDIKSLLGFMFVAGEITKTAPLEITHKYLVRNESYAEFISLINNALPNDMFGDDEWIDELKKTIKNKEHLHKLEELVKNFDLVRTFMRNNKMFDKVLCGYPDPELDAKILERFINGDSNNKTD